MKVGEIWQHRDEGFTIRLTRLFKKTTYLAGDNPELTDFVEYKVVDDPTRDVLDGDFPVFVLLNRYFKVYKDEGWRNLEE